MNCSPTSQIDNIGEEEMDASTTHHKRKVRSLKNNGKTNMEITSVEWSSWVKQYTGNSIST